MVKEPEIDYGMIAETLKNKAGNSSFSDKVEASKVRNRLHKVAFDVYSIENDPYDGLWKLEAASDGKEYLVRIDSEPAVEVKTGGWTATANDNGTSLTLAYKGMPIQRLSAKIFGFSKSDVIIFKRALLEKVVSNSSFRDMLIDMQPEDKKRELIKLFPELALK